jgi:hypothetical protein
MPDDERVAVQTYVPAAQRDRWQREAEERDMSHAEYVRTMVQAGRRSFELRSGPADSDTGSESREEGESSTTTPRVEELEDRVLDILREAEFADWETLLAGVTDDIEERLEETLDELQSEDRIRYSGRRDGYTVTDDER